MLCPKCRRNFPQDDGFCPYDGSPLVKAASVHDGFAPRSKETTGTEQQSTTRMSAQDVATALSSEEFAEIEEARRVARGEEKSTTRMSADDVEAALASDAAPIANPQGAREPSRQNPTVNLSPPTNGAGSIRPAPLPLQPLERSLEPPQVLLSSATVGHGPGLGPGPGLGLGLGLGLPQRPGHGTPPEITESFTNIQVGSTVGEYQITGVLGHGGMTQVYAGVHPVIGKRVALKVLHARYSGDEGLLGRFIQEAQAVNHVGSDRIVDIFGFGHLPDGRAYLVMNQVDGQSLADLIEAGGPLATTQAHSIFLDVASALAAAHSVGIIHRDIKPANIMVQTDTYGAFRAKVLDFGVAKLLCTDAHSPGVNTAKGTMIGTPLYMSPEQVRGQSVDARSDAYALGVTMFQCLTGDIPFEVNYDMDIAVAHVEIPPRVPSSLRPNLSQEWDQLILDCLEKAPARRPHSMAEVQTRLAQLGLSATRGGTGYVDLPSYVKPQDLITALDASPGRPPKSESASRLPMILAALTGTALCAGALLYWLAG